MLEIVGETLEAGAIVAGAYRLERVLGEGGMGVVWAAREIATDRAVALKFLQQDRESDPRSQERFLREARAAMAVVHPNVAKVHAVMETDAGIPFLVMELLEGESLRSVLVRRGKLPLPECAELLLPVVAAVRAAHAKHIIHRDLKPENIFLAKGPRLLVLDFGLAKQIARTEDQSKPSAASLTSTGALMGTPFYMAPEQIFAEADIDGRVDVWALGIVLYECLAGRRPTDVEGFGPLLKRITSEPFVPIEQLCPGLPPQVARLIARMLSRDRAGRPSLEEIQQTLEAPDERSPATVPLPPIERAPSYPHPHVATFPAAPTPPPPPTPAPRDPPMLSQKALVAIIAIPLTALVVTVAIRQTQIFERQQSAAVPRPSINIKIPPISLDGGGPKNAAGLILGAQRAEAERDGVTCLRKLDEADALAKGTSQPSTDPASGNAGIRATCLMLTGRCEEGKTLWRKWSSAHSPPPTPPATIEQSLDTVVARCCEGDNLTPRDALLRAAGRLADVASNRRVPTRAECKEWHATVHRLGPTVAAPASDVSVTAALATVDPHAVTCFAKTGDCATALQVYRGYWEKSSGSQNEAMMRAGYEGIVTSTPCKGRP